MVMIIPVGMVAPVANAQRAIDAANDAARHPADDAADQSTDRPEHTIAGARARPCAFTGTFADALGLGSGGHGKQQKKAGNSGRPARSHFGSSGGSVLCYRTDQIDFWQEQAGLIRQAQALPCQMPIPARHTGVLSIGQLTAHPPQAGCAGARHAWSSPKNRNASAGGAATAAAPTRMTASDLAMVILPSLIGGSF